MATDLTLVVLHYAIGGAEAQAGSLPDWLGCIEGIKHSFGIANARPRIGKLDDNFVCLRTGIHGKDSAADLV